VLQAEPDATAAERDAAVARVQEQVATLDDVTLPPPAAAQARRQLQAGTDVVLVPLRSDLSSDELIDPAATLREDLDPGTVDAGVTSYLVGQPTIWAGMQEISKEDLAKAEGTGFPIVAIILLVVFGSLAAAALPLALGFVSVLVTGALIYFFSLQLETSVFVTNMASMIGIASPSTTRSSSSPAIGRSAKPGASRRRRGRSRSPPPASRSPSPASP